MTAKDDKLQAKKDRFKVLEEYWAENRRLFKQDKEFAAGKQWPIEIERAREADGRPCLTVDKSGQYIRQVVNDSRQNRPAIKVRPIDDAGDVEVADALQGLVRHIADRSNADDAYDCAIENAVVGGFGFISVNTEYAHENTFNQEVCIDREPNPLAILMAPHNKADGSDAADVFRYADMPKAEFKETYPDAEETDWEADGFKEGWTDEHTVRVCEHFWTVTEKVKTHILIDGTLETDEDYQNAVVELGPDLVPPIVDTRDLPTTKVKWCRMTGAEILEERDWLGKFLPIVPVYGNESNIEGKTIYSGLIRPAKSAMMLYNFGRTAFAESLALSNKVPFIASAEALEGHEEEWQNANNSTAAVLHYNAFDAEGNQIPAPQRQPAFVAPAGFAQDMQISEHDIQASMGMFNASLGEKSNEKSGKAIMARQREGDTATFHFQDNLNRAVRRVGVICVDLAPKVYDSKRTIRILGEDGEATDATVDPNQEMAHQKIGGRSVYNLGIGKYDVNISAGASYTTRRVEQAEAMMQLIQASPEMMQIAGDLVVKSQDWPNAEELAERYKMMLPPQIQQSLEQEGEQPPEVQQIQMQAQQAIQQRDQQIQEMGQALQEAQTTVQKLELQSKSSADKNQVDMFRAQIEQFKAETDRMQAESSMSEAPPQDNTALDALRLEYEDRWKKLDSETRIFIAELQTRTTLQTASLAAQQAEQQQPADAGFFTPNESQ